MAWEKKEQVLDLLTRRLAAYQELLDISSRQHALICACKMEEFDKHVRIQDDLIQKINQFNSELEELVSDNLFAETEMFEALVLKTDECIQKLHDVFQQIQKVLHKKRDEVGRELLMLKNRSKVLNSYKQGGTF